MANIGTQPTAAELLRSHPAGSRGRYGEHLTFIRDEDSVKLLATEDADPVAVVGFDSIHVDVDQLNALPDEAPRFLPYLNAFVAYSNQKVEKYWRTKEYRVIPIDKLRPVLTRIPQVTHVEALIASEDDYLSPRELRRILVSLLRAVDALEAREGK